MTQHKTGWRWIERLGRGRTAWLEGGGLVWLRNRVVSLLAAFLCTGAAHTEQFEIELGDTISEGVPGVGAGYIETAGTTDTYTFAAEAGQIVFLEELSFAPSFEGWLYWELRSASNELLSGGYFQGVHEGRKVLPASGTYAVIVKVLAANPDYIGAYSFRIRMVPDDHLFSIEVGDTVTVGVPGSGAGTLEEPGAHDIYQFTADAGSLAFFERLSVSAAFEGWLQWELKAPSGQLVFRSYFGTGHDGRKLLPESGVYTLKVSDGTTTTTHVGEYAFRIRAIPPDGSFPIQVGQTISGGIPAAGAGNIEWAGSWDYYTFAGHSGETLFFEDLESAGSLGGWLQWEGLTPSGGVLFRQFFGNGSVGSKTLPETGTYTIRCWVGSNDPALTGSYSFRISGVSNGEYSLGIGDVVTNGIPAVGAGVLETAGAEDVYTFPGVAGQKVVFEEFEAAAAIAGWLRWEVTTPSGQRLFARYFEPGYRERLALPETGVYRARVFAGASDPNYFGHYSFRTYIEVFARPDWLAVEPGATIAIPRQKFLCNDVWDSTDSVLVELPVETSSEGGTLIEGTKEIVYAPPAGFVGVDTFAYRLRGQFGGVHVGLATVHVMEGASSGANVVSTIRLGADVAQACLLGLPGQAYRVERSDDLSNWLPTGQITADVEGSMIFEYSTATGSECFYRFPKL